MPERVRVAGAIVVDFLCGILSSSLPLFIVFSAPSMSPTVVGADGAIVTSEVFSMLCSSTQGGLTTIAAAAVLVFPSPVPVVSPTFSVAWR